jgi:hypothetical protein
LASGGWIRPLSTLSLTLIAAVYIGFAVRTAGRSSWLSRAASRGSCVLAAIGVTGPAWLLVLGFTGHGLKDVWQERRHNVANTRW